MEKRLKYLLGFLVLGFGLLFSSQSFADNVTIDGVVSSYNCANGCATYRYIFNNRKYINGGNSSYNAGFLGYQMNYDGVVHEDVFGTAGQGVHCSDISSVYNRLFNSSIYEFLPYSGSCASFSSSYYTWSSPNNYNYYTNSGSIINVALGRNTEFGRAFVGLSTNNGNTPKYGFGNSFAGINDYLIVNSANAGYYRFFYDLVNGHNPLNGFDPITLSGQYMTGLNAWEYLYYNGTRTNYGYIVDDGSVGTKFRHFGLFDMGYSYSYGQGLSQSSTTINWNQLKFTTVEDNIETALKLFGDVSYSDFNNYSYHGLLLVKGNTSTDLNAGNGVYILSKDPTNVSRILYEHWSCNISNIGLIYSGGNDSVDCVKLDAGYLTYSGSTSVLPFTSSTDSVPITGRNVSFPLLFDLAYQNTTTAGRTLFSGGKLCFLSDIYCYGFQTNSNVSIKDLYLNGGTNSVTSNQINSGFISECASNSTFYQNNFVVCSALLQNIGQPVQIPGTNDQYVSYGYDNSGNLTIWVTTQDDLIEQMSGYEWVQNDDGSRSTVCVSESCNPNYNSGIIATGTLGVSYYENFFKSGMFFHCPYSYSGLNFTIGKRLSNKLGIDILFPINCMIAGYTYGKDFHIFNSSGTVLSSRLFNSEDYRTLYNFFDVVISLGILFLMFRIYRLIK